MEAWWKSAEGFKDTNALSFYRSKMILDRPKQFGQVISKSFWLGLNHFGRVHIRLFWTSFYDVDLSKMISTWPKQIGPVQNNWSKIIFGP